MVKFCSNCGVEIKDNANFCPNCGLKFSKDSEFSKQSKPETTPWALVLIAVIAGAVLFSLFNSNPASTDTSKEKQTEIRYIQVTPEETPTPEIRYVYAVPEATPITSSPLSSDTLNSIQEARNDFSWRLDLLNEQQRRIDTLFAVKAGVSMQQKEYKGRIDALTAAVKEYYVRVTNAANSGQSYGNLLNANIDSLDTNFYNSEIKLIKKNYDIMTSDSNLNTESLNNAINSYNNCFVYKTGCS